MEETVDKKVYTLLEYRLLLRKLQKAGYYWLDGDSLSVPFVPDEPFPIIIHLLTKSKKIYWSW